MLIACPPTAPTYSKLFVAPPPGVESIRRALDQLSGISLADLDQAQLHDRVESKVILNRGDLPAAIARLGTDYLVLDHDDERLQRYSSDYFDTADLRNYHEHHNQFGRRIKIRYRTYLNSNLTYFELKRNLHGRTIKERRRTEPPSGGLHREDAAFLFARTGNRPSQYHHSLKVEYERILLVRRDFSERVTIDLNLGFSTGSTRSECPGLAIVEFKQPALDLRSPAMEAMQQRPQMFSKYCMGLASCEPHLRSNRFKKVFRSLAKLNASPIPIGSSEEVAA